MGVIIKQMKNKQKIILNLVVCLVLFFVCTIVLGAGPPPVATPPDVATLDNPLHGINSLPQLLQRVTSFVQSVALALMPIFIVWGGVTIMTSNGNPEKVKEGKNIILYTMVGVIVTFLANVMIDVVAQLFQTP